MLGDKVRVTYFYESEAPVRSDKINSSDCTTNYSDTERVRIGPHEFAVRKGDPEITLYIDPNNPSNNANIKITAVWE